MSFSSLLSEIKHKSKDSEAKPSYSYNSSGQNKSNNRTSSSPTPARAPSQPSRSRSELPRVIDPAVQRLKELRRVENAKKEASQSKPKTQRRKPTSSSSASSSSIIRRRTPEVRLKESVMVNRPRASSPQKRLSFAELMKQAQDKTKSLKDAKSEEPVEAATSATNKYVSKTHPKATQSNHRDQRSTSAPSSATGVRRPPNASTSSSYSRHSSARPAPSRPAVPRSQRAVERTISRPKEYAKPSAQLQAKLDAKRKREQARRESTRKEDEDSYESEFVKSDEEEDYCHEKDPGYDRDEIWKIFSRGKSRNDYIRDDEYDLSDMEATGDEVMKEEMRSAKRARMEELAEQERERKRQEEKRRRLGRK